MLSYLQALAAHRFMDAKINFCFKRKIIFTTPNFIYCHSKLMESYQQNMVGFRLIVIQWGSE